MHRSRKRRFSRLAIGMMAIVVILAAAFTIHNLDSSQAPQPAQAAEVASAPHETAAVSTPAKSAEAPEAAQTPETTAAMVTQTPSVTVQPVVLTQSEPAGTSATSAAPATRPAGEAQPAQASPQIALPDHPAVTMTAEQAKVTLQEGQAQFKAGDLLHSRYLLNQALQSGKLDLASLAAAKAMISHINQTVIFSAQRFDDDPYGGTFTVPAGAALAKIGQRYHVPWELLAHINNLTPRSLRAGQTIKIVKGPFHAVINKSAFTLDVYLKALPGQEGSMYVTTLPVGLGRDNSTPTGLWDVGGKLKNPKFWGLSDMKPVEGGDPDNPLGKYWIALIGLDGHAVGKESYGIHGTNDPNSIGTMSSHGCIRLRDADIALLYSLLNSKGSTVLVVK